MASQSTTQNSPGPRWSDSNWNPVLSFDINHCLVPLEHLQELAEIAKLLGSIKDVVLIEQFVAAFKKGELSEEEIRGKYRELFEELAMTSTDLYEAGEIYRQIMWSDALLILQVLREAGMDVALTTTAFEPMARHLAEFAGIPNDMIHAIQIKMEGDRVTGIAPSNGLELGNKQPSIEQLLETSRRDVLHFGDSCADTHVNATSHTLPNGRIVRCTAIKTTTSIDREGVDAPIRSASWPAMLVLALGKEKLQQLYQDHEEFRAILLIGMDMIRTSAVKFDDSFKEWQDEIVKFIKQFDRDPEFGLRREFINNYEAVNELLLSMEGDRIRVGNWDLVTPELVEYAEGLKMKGVPIQWPRPIIQTLWAIKSTNDPEILWRRFGLTLEGVEALLKRFEGHPYFEDATTAPYPEQRFESIQ